MATASLQVATSSIADVAYIVVAGEYLRCCLSKHSSASDHKPGDLDKVPWSGSHSC